MKVTVTACPTSASLASASRNTGALTVVTVESSPGRTSPLVGAALPVTVSNTGGDTAVLPVSSVATA